MTPPAKNVVLSGRELLHEWQRLMQGVAESAASTAGRTALPHQLVEAMQRQTQLVEEVLERERRLQSELVERAFAPVDAVFGMLEETGATLKRQAEALEAAGRALEETAALRKRQAELFEQTVGTLRRPAALAQAAAGVKQSPRRKTSKRGR